MKKKTTSTPSTTKKNLKAPTRDLSPLEKKSSNIKAGRSRARRRRGRG